MTLALVLITILVAFIESFLESLICSIRFRHSFANYVNSTDFFAFTCHTTVMHRWRDAIERWLFGWVVWLDSEWEKRRYSSWIPVHNWCVRPNCGKARHRQWLGKCERRYHAQHWKPEELQGCCVSNGSWKLCFSRLHNPGFLPQMHSQNWANDYGHYPKISHRIQWRASSRSP